MRTVLEPLAPSEAIEFFRSKGFAGELQRFDWRDLWREEHARSFVVAKAMQDDVLATIRAAVDRALAEGRTLDQFRAELRPQLEAFGWWGRKLMTDPLTGETKEVRLGSPHRLRVIFDTNLRTSYAAGRWARIQRTKAAFPYLEYRQIDRPSKREAHKPYDGLILPVDARLWAEIYPPNGWFCGCSVRQVNERMLKREGKKPTEGFRPERQAWTNRRTGRVEFPPKGVDPGFDANPGAAWLDLRRAHEATAAHLTGPQRAAERGLIQEVRARGLRDGDETLALLDLAPRRGKDPVLGWTRSAEGEPLAVAPTPAMLAAMRDPRRELVAVHDHPTSSPFSSADLLTLASSPGLREVVAVGLDGSIWRARDSAGLDLREVHAAFMAASEALASAVLRGEIDRADALALRSHLAARALHEAGRMEYTFHMRGRILLTHDRTSAVLDSLVAEVVRRLGRP